MYNIQKYTKIQNVIKRCITQQNEIIIASINIIKNIVLYSEYIPSRERERGGGRESTGISKHQPCY